MERERWLKLVHLIQKLGKDFPSGWKFPTTTIVMVFFWAVQQDRPIACACEVQHWPKDLPRPHLPSQDRMSRRLRTPPVQGLIQAVENALKQPPQPVQVIDSKPLTVGVCSKDRQARWGVSTGGKLLRGYKLHAIWDGGWLPTAWRITAMNVQDGVGGRPLLQQLTGQGCVLGDGPYDQNQNYDNTAARGYQLLAMPRCAGAGRGHRRQSPFRQRGLQLRMEVQDWFRAARGSIERCFSGLTSYGGGLTCLPPWVRGLARVTRWVQAKLILNALRIQNHAHALANA